MKIDRRQFIAGGLASLLITPLLNRVAHAGTPAKKLIVILARGAWDVANVFDPRAPGDANIDGPWRQLPGGEIDYTTEKIAQIGNLTFGYNDTNGSIGYRPNVSSFFSEWSDLCLVVNGVASGTIVHDLARTRVLTGARGANPDLGAIFGNEKKASAPIGYMDFSGEARIGNLGASTAQIGQRGQLEILLNDEIVGIPGPQGSGLTYPLFAPTNTDHDAIQAWLTKRENRLKTRWEDGGPNTQQLANLAGSRAAAEDLRASSDKLNELINLGAEMNLQSQLDLGIKLLNDELCQSVLLDTGFGWDTHDNNSGQNGLFDQLFTELNYLASELTRQKLEEEVLVVVLSEFTRTPKLNATGGKDHWPVISALLFGAGIEGGRTIGKTSDTLGSEPVNLSTGAYDVNGTVPDYGNLIAGILEAAGIENIGDYLPGSTPYSAIKGV
jgi:hypothetical protein